MRWKPHIVIVVTMVVSALVLTMAPGVFAAKYKVGIIQLVEHPSLDDIRDGIIAGLANSGFYDDIDIDYKNAQNDMSLLATITRNMIQQRVDVLIPITTPAAQTAASLARNIPVVFAGLNDPVSAGLIESFERPGRNMTGSSHYQPPANHAGLILEIMTDAKRIGTVYNPGEFNSVTQVIELRKWAEEMGLTLVERPISQSVEVQQATESMVGLVDAIYIGNDNTVVAGLEGLLHVTYRAKIPVFTADADSVKRGAIGAYGADFYELGVKTADLVIAILRDGADPGSLPVALIEQLELALNLTGADEIGLAIPESVRQRASMTY